MPETPDGGYILDDSETTTEAFIKRLTGGKGSETGQDTKTGRRRVRSISVVSKSSVARRQTGKRKSVKQS